MDFTDLGILPVLAQILEKRDMTPLPVQTLAIPVLLEEKSVMLTARTGSGKTLAYLLPLLSRVDPKKSDVQAVILAPTHELAMQIYRVAAELVRDAALSVRVQALIGGVAVARQVDGLKKKPHIVVGSAGRITHLMELGKLKLHSVRRLIFDETDRLLLEEGMPHIRRIVAAPKQKPVHVFVSATEGPTSTRIARELAPDLKILRVQEERINPAIRHAYLVCEERDKADWARKIVRGLESPRTLIFVHRNDTARHTAERLRYHGLAVADLYGAQDKLTRQAALEQFRKGRITVLIASDIAARGLDIADVDLVINLDAPSQSRDYLHRAGRTGRVDQKGLVLSLITPAETRLPRRYKEELGIEPEEVRMIRGALVTADQPAPRPRRATKSPARKKPESK
jgi:superfamily II DNA/RNA helicase